MITGGTGGANTNKSGLSFEADNDLKSWAIENNIIYGSKSEIKKFAKDYFNINSKERWPNQSRGFQPDAFLFKNDKLTIIEMKNQNSTGSTDVKIVAGDFYLSMYNKLIEGTNVNLEYHFLLSKWFKDKKYIDYTEYSKKFNINSYFDINELKKYLNKRHE